MRKTIYIFFVFISYTVYSQSLSVFNVDASAFPSIKASFLAFDTAGIQITNLSNSDFSITENGQQRTVTNVSCPDPKLLQNVSLAISMDVSGSMSYNDNGEILLELGKTTARELCNSLPIPPSEVALQTCDTRALIIQDFTYDKTKILTTFDSLSAHGGNDFVEQLQNRLTGLLNLAKTGKHKRVAVLLTDACWFALTAEELQSCLDTCSKYKIQFFAVIYSRPDAEVNGIKSSLQSIADATGGYLYDGITSTTATKNIANRLQVDALDGDPCQIEWLSGITCISSKINVELKLIPNNTIKNLSYQSKNNLLAKLEFAPVSVKFKNAIPGIKKDTTITVTAKNADFNVTKITSSNSTFAISPTSFVLNSGQSLDLTISFVPADSGYTYSKFMFENDNCMVNYYASGGFAGRKATIQTIKLINPNGGEEFAVGSDTVITWEGVLPDDIVNIEYTTDNGLNWIPIADTVTGFSYSWRVHNTPSNQCLARVTVKHGYLASSCDNGEVRICNQTWMGCNLDVEFYRDGTPIPEVTDSIEWVNLKTGAWCYYNNDPALGAIYGKLYNWYAVNDPRGLAPEGWHIPTDEEWTALEDCLGGSDLAGGKLKSIEDGFWFAPNVGATNSSGFSALPGGYRCRVGALNSIGVYSSIGSYSRWWSSTSEIFMGAWGRCLFSDAPFIQRNSRHIVEGYYVRCIKD